MPAPNSSERRLFTAREMTQVADALHFDQRIARKIDTDSEMVDGGYIASLTPAEVARLAHAGLPTGRASSTQHPADGGP